VGEAVRIPPIVRRAIADHAEESYPEEGCGFLLGHTSDGAREVVQALPARNARVDSARNRYLIEPLDFLSAEKEARSRALNIIGFYHSHPDHPAHPSEFDREHAWPWYAYVIVPVERGRSGTPRAWFLEDDRLAFIEAEIE
jgi:proteasome lid subunit RPN8/RPN11